MKNYPARRTVERMARLAGGKLEKINGGWRIQLKGVSVVRPTLGKCAEFLAGRFENPEGKIQISARIPKSIYKKIENRAYLNWKSVSKNVSMILEEYFEGKEGGKCR